MSRPAGRPGNRAPLNVLPRAMPTNRIPGAQLAPPRLLAAVAAAAVEQASSASVVPPDFTDAVAALETATATLETATATLETVTADHESRITALEP